ncbi:MAG: hypothetical protein IKX81_03315 [Firmicutes bacterium]|nr:hypothetical protein [Bacillota bacterium]
MEDHIHDHDHEHEHHHHDHDHHDHDHHHHHHENIEITTHEDAVIASVKMALPGDEKEAEVTLKSFMRAVAEETEALGGTIGHIKFFLKNSRGTMYSMTDTEDINKKTAPNLSFSAEGVAIVLGLTEEQLGDIVTLHYPGAV